ncbi:MAG: hypothetical protein ACLGI2_02185 [Acidimicrobiia bacterium]
MENDLIGADFFKLDGEARVTYNARSMLLHYEGPSRPPLRDFVVVVETVPPVELPIGRLVTATLRSSPDGDSDTITLLLPDVNVGRSGGECAFEAAFRAPVVWTTIRSTLGGPGLVDGPVHLYTHRELDGTAGLGRHACTFTAVLNMGLPGPGAGPGQLVVEGECTLPSRGWSVELGRHEPQGINPRDLLLDLTVTPPSPDEVVLPVLTKYPLTYQEETQVLLQTVTVLPHGTSVEVDIIT